MEAIQLLFDKIRALQAESEALDRALANQAPVGGDGESDESDADESSESKQLRRDCVARAREAQLMADREVPEGLPDDGEFQYFLAVAEVQKNIDELKVLRVMSEKNLDFMQRQIQLNENLILELEERKKEYRAEAEAKKQKRVTAAALLSDRSNESDERKELLRSLDRRVRATRLVYKEFKTFLGEFLVGVAPDPDEGSRLAHLMQDLYSSFWENGSEEFLKLSHLEYDVSESDVATLLKHGIIERDADDKGAIRLVDFTQ